MRNLREDGWLQDSRRRDDGGRSDARDAGILAMATRSSSARWPPTASCAPAASPARTTKTRGARTAQAGADADLRRRRAAEKPLRAQAAVVRQRQRRDVLFFTQELSTLLNAGRAARPRALHHRRTDRAVQFPLHRAGRSARAQGRQDRWPTAWRRIPTISPISTSTWCAPAKPRARWPSIFERLAEFERSRDDLRNYIISSMIYPALLAAVGLGSIVVLLTFVVPRFADDLRAIRT